jgi:hypothetical protein
MKNSTYTKKEIEAIVKDFENRGIGVKEVKTENGALIIKWADAKQTGKEESIYFKMLGA